MKLKLDMSYHLLNAYTKFQIDISKHVEKKSGKLGRTDGRTDGQTDGHCHSIIRPFFKRAYKNLGQYDQNAIPSQIMPCYSYPGNLVNQNDIPIWVNMLASSSGTNYVLNEHEDVGQYGPYVILSEVIPGYRYPASLLDQFEILIDSSC